MRISELETHNLADRTYTLSSPFVTLKWDSRPDHFVALFLAWMFLWGIVTGILMWFYIILLPDVIGFDKTVLLGIALLVIGVGGSE